MRTIRIPIIAVAVAMLFVGALHAQEMSGDWQGTLKAAADHRIILHFTKTDDGRWRAIFYDIDVSSEGRPVSTLTLQGSDLKFSIGPLHASYEGKISANGASVAGTWNQSNVQTPLTLQRATKETAWQRDSSPHTTMFVTVDKDVKLEVLDWGGTGRPLVFLAGLGNTAHVFDKFAPKFVPAYHVYGITRRGFGDSSAPIPTNYNYSADRLGDDVLAVIASLNLDHPVLAGHSIAGEELSSIGSRHPEKIAGLVYLDAGYWYAYYDRSKGNVTIDSNELKNKLDVLPVLGAPDGIQMIEELLHTSLPRIEKDLQDQEKWLQALPPEYQVSLQPEDVPVASAAIIAGEKQFTGFRVPILAIFAMSNTPSLRQMSEDAAKGFETAFPLAHVVRLQNASHAVYNSNEADVLHEMNAFLADLKE